MMARLPSRIAFVCADAGGACALLPIFKHLRRNGTDVFAFVSGPSINMFDMPSSVSLLDDELSVDQATICLMQKKAQFLLSAAGAFNQIEHTFRLAAKSLGLPIIAVVDGCNDFESRFQRKVSGKLETSYPELICTSEKTTITALPQVAQIGSTRVITTGSPYLETLHDLKARRISTRLRLRQVFDIHDNEFCILFLSEPIIHRGSNDCNAKTGKHVFTYTPEEILKSTLSRIQAMRQETELNIHFLLRAHPRDNRDHLAMFFHSLPHHGIIYNSANDHDLEEYVAASDLVLGMTTIALSEAAIAGVPVLSIQPCLRSLEDSLCLGSKIGLFEVITTWNTFDRKIRDIASHRYRFRKRRKTFWRGATERIVAEINRLSQQSEAV